MGSDVVNYSLRSLVTVMVCLWIQGLQKKMDRNLTLWFMTFPSEHCHSVTVVGCLTKKVGHKPYPMDL